MTCKHKNTTTGQHYGYTDSVATKTDEQNPAAHTLTCNDCGATRRINENGRHAERGPWIALPEPVVTPWTVESYTVRRRGCTAWENCIPSLNRAMNECDNANHVCAPGHVVYAEEIRTVDGVPESRSVQVYDGDVFA